MLCYTHTHTPYCRVVPILPLMLVDKVRVVPRGEATDPEDYFSAALGIIFTDDLRNEHGDPGATVIYRSDAFGDISLSVADPASEDDRKLFAHYLWNAAIYVAECISPGDSSSWPVSGESVLELGAGLGLGGIVSCLSGASKVVITDYPTPNLLDNISQNVEANIKYDLRSRITVSGHQWGDFDTTFAQANKGQFTRILCADCLWMPWEHHSLARSMAFYLSPDPASRVYVVAGFHTGRAKLAPFFDVVVEEGFAVDELFEENVEGQRRPWAKERDGGRENPTERKRWLAVAVLKRTLPTAETV